ncbi:MAG: D-alanyl-D-alanine carboxypeptidase family protein [Haliscomenobacter sp.]|nr:D-alanyl-D-alanine carboxypeptidase family protein [Haliscomenobacter sp.]MBK7475092.1 D-alanyl-D-alanine carboxypeptidase family protein [Haliscomenobacter sp.]MBK8879900.1 D-alanyl-D-alanine carboxypeptidase family protein [Haliscomenobacter sp.]
MKRFVAICLSFLLVSCAQDKKPDRRPFAAATTNAGPSSVSASSPEQTPVFDLSYLMGKFDPASHPDFVEINLEHASRKGMFLRRDVYDAFKKMYAAALKDGIRLRIISAARNFDAQKGIWEAKWTGARWIENGKNASEAYPDPVERALKILEYSSMPGSSRHHWGTDMDLNDLNPEWFRSGEGKKIHDWLTANGAAYGFCQPYSPKGKDRLFGYNEEQWHWSYMPVSKTLTELARQSLKNDMISGFEGANTAAEIGIVQKYVLGINPVCR